MLPTLLRKGERLLVFLPLAHVLARALTLCAFHNKVVVGFTSDIKNLVPMFAVFKPTVVVSVPRVFEKVYNTAAQNAANDGKGRIFEMAAQTAVDWSEASDNGGPGLLLRAKHALFDRLVYHKLRAALGGDCNASVSGGGPLGARLGHFYRGVGLTIYEGYGLTETSAAITVNQIDALKVGTVGKLLPGNSMRIADDGELLLRGGVVFGGYWHNDQATDEAFEDGWFKTGDLGAVDEQGFLTITGRKKEIIVTAGGKNVAPAVLEDQLRAHPLISQAMVVGDAKPFIGALITIDPEAFEGWKQRNGKPAGSSVGDLANDPDLLAEVDARRQTSQSVCVACGVDSQIPHSARRLHRGHRRADPDDEGEAQGGCREVRRRHRGDLQQGLAADQAGQPPGQIVPPPLRGGPLPAGGAHRGGAIRIGQQLADRVGDLLHRTTIDHHPSLVVPHRFRCATRGSGDHRHTGGRCFQEDDAQPFDIQPGAASPARHGEHVGHRVIGGQVGRRHTAGERDVIGDAETLGQPAQRVQIRTAAGDDQRGTVHPLPDRRQRPDQHVLALARYQPGQAQHRGPLAQTVAGAQLGAADRIGTESFGVDAGRQVFQPGSRPERRRETPSGVSADECDDITVLADATQHRPCHRKHRPTHLVTVRARQHPARTGLTGAVGQQAQRRRGAEPDGVDAVFGDQPAHPGVDGRYGQHQRPGMSHHAIAGGLCVEDVGVLPLRRVHRQRVLAGSGQPRHQLDQIRLDAATPRRKVVGYQQDPGHLRRLA